MSPLRPEQRGWVIVLLALGPGRDRLRRAVSSIAVVGTGYVGLTTAVCLADLGHSVVGLDIDARKIASLRAGVPTIHEPGLPELMANAIEADRLRFTTDYSEAIPDAEFAFIAVATPMARRGEADLTFVRHAAKSIAASMTRPLTIVNKSTVPIGTADIVSQVVRENLAAEMPFQVVSNPEFLREGSAVHDFMHPDRLVFGGHDLVAAQAVAALFRGLTGKIVLTDIYTAEMIKYASNAFLATRISFINEVARICERVGADVKVVAEGMGLDRRIGPLFLEAGIGYGGSCFPKDVRALSRIAETLGYHPQLLDAVMEINRDQRQLVIDKVTHVLGRLRGQTIGVLGLAFKPDTDDIREAPALDVIRGLLQQGALVRAYDPVAMPAARAQFNSIKYCESPYMVASGADALVLATEWQEFHDLDLQRLKRLMRRPVFIDGRNLFDPGTMRDLGFVYQGIGRG